MRTLPFLLAGALLVPVLSAPSSAQTPATNAAATSEDARLTAFLDAEFAKALVLEPETATGIGLKQGNDRWDDNSQRGQKARLDLMRASVARMKKQFDRAKLSNEGQVNYDLWASRLEYTEAAYKYRKWVPPLYSFLGPDHTNTVNFLLSGMAVNDADDMRGWIARVKKLPMRLDQSLADTKASAKAGIRLPAFQAERVRDTARKLVAGAPYGGEGESPLWEDAQAKIAALDAASKLAPGEADRMRADARAAIAALKPSVDRIAAWADKQAGTAPSGKVGAVTLPQGKAFYAAALKLSTTTDMTAAEIHRTGLEEIVRIAAEQDAIARKAGFKDRDAFYADRARRFPAVAFTDASRAAYLKDANDTIARALTRVPERFDLRMAYPVQVIREPAFSEIPGGAAHAAFPAADGSRPGLVYVHLSGNTLDPGKLPALMCHEGVPGHVMQGDIMVRQQGVPKFRTAGYGYNAYIEGWALYAEQLCDEMGVYREPAEKFMALDREIYRSVRLVVDTGLHDLGWTEDEAIAYMVKTGRLPEQQARAEVRRYITMPGQATGYKIGMLEIEELRARAEAALGPKFDIKSFDDLVIGGGAMPLSILERRVDEWIAARR